MSALTDIYVTFLESFKSIFYFHICLIYLSPYINFLWEISMYIKGRNSIKQ